jgi:pyruvate formate lyase activating enzyme
MEQQGYPESLWIRTPIIPDATDTVENISAIGKWIADHLDGLADRWELCTFNNLCKDKYTRLGIEWSFSDAELLEKAHIEKLTHTAKKSGVNPDIIFWSGSTKIEKVPTNHSRQATELRLVTP